MFQNNYYFCLDFQKFKLSNIFTLSFSSIAISYSEKEFIYLTCLLEGVILLFNSSTGGCY